MRQQGEYILIKTLWFLLKIIVVSVAAVWLATREGVVSMSFSVYDLKMQAGIFWLALFVGAFIFYYSLRLIGRLFSAPKAITNYVEKDKQKKGYRAITRGLVAVAVGDTKRASHFSKQASSYLKDDNALPLLLEAQAARLRGEEALAQNKFEALMSDKDAAFLGVRGLLKSAIEEGDMNQALEYARRAQTLHPHQDWIIRNVYELEIRNGLWSDAIQTGKNALRRGALSEEKIISDRAAIYLMRHDYNKDQGNDDAAFKDLKQAHKLNPNFIPTVTRFADYYLSQGKRRKAVKLIEQAWPHNPHPDLADLWDKLCPHADNQDKRLKWYEDLVALKTDSVEGHMAAARAAMDMNLWGEAKSYLNVAEKIYPSARVYRTRAIVEQNSTHNEDAINELMEKAANAMLDRKWVCCQTGLTYDSWSALAMPHQSFNTIIWDYPGTKILRQQEPLLGDQNAVLMIDPAA